MTDDAFGRLLYTDCKPGTGRGSGGGFQVQAQSDNVDSRQSSTAVSWLLYEAQTAWIAERRPLEDFPPGFAHVSEDGCYGTAQGRYLGKEAVGGRQGNYLADCLLTRDPAKYGSTRPAQLWQSELWQSRPWPTIHCPPFNGDLEPGPLGDLEKVAEWVRELPEGETVLARLLSVLEDADGQRVVIVSDDVDEAMRWVAAVTLLLPQRRALGLSFKVFSAAPLRARQRLVAAPAGLNPELRPGRGTGMFVVDASTCTSDEAAVTERAAFLSAKLAGDADPYDIVDAADMADVELCEGAWPQHIGALAAAWRLTVPDSPAPDPRVLYPWLRTASKRTLGQHGTALAEALLEGDAPADALAWLDAKIAARELEFDPDIARTRLLAAEIVEVLAGRPAPDTPLEAVALSDRARRDASSALTSALLRGSGGDLDLAEVDHLLRLAHRHGVTLEPPSPPVRDVLHRFAVEWIDKGNVWDPEGRALADEVLDSAYAELQARFGKDRSSAGMRATLDRLAPYFDNYGDLTDDLHCYLQAASLAGLQGPERVKRFNKLFADVRKLPRDTADPTRAALNLQQALLDLEAMDPTMAIAILGSLPEPAISPGVGTFATRWLTEHSKHPDTRLLRVLDNLDKLGKVPKRPARLAELATGSRKVSEFLDTAKNGDVTDDTAATTAAAIAAIAEADLEVVTIQRAEILGAFTGNPDLAAMVFATLPKSNKVAQALTRLAGRRVKELDTYEDRLTWTILIAHIVGHPRFPDHRFNDFYAMLGSLYSSVSSGRGGTREAEKWYADVYQHLEGEAQRIEWDRLIGHLSNWKIRGKS